MNNIVKIMIFLYYVISRRYYALCELHCSRSISRKVSYEIHQLFKEEANFFKLMKPECPLNLENHIYNMEENNKIVYPNGEIQCGFCKEILSNENNYDLHMEKNHSNQNISKEFICIEKLCILFGQCGENEKLHVCMSILDHEEEITNFCLGIVNKCFREDDKTSRFYKTKMIHRLCRKDKILSVNGCIESKKVENKIIEMLIFHFSKILLLLLIMITFYISYKANKYINKIK